MLTANTTLNIWVALMTKLNTHLNQLSNTRINCSEGVVRQNALSKILRNKFCFNVVTGETKGGLCKVVGTEAEEVCLSCNFVSSNSSTRKLNHGTNWNVKLYTLLSLNLSNSSLSELAKLLKLRNNRNQRNHNFWLRIKTLLLEFGSSSSNSTNLHLRKNWELNSQTATTKTEHWVCFTHAINLLHETTLLLDNSWISASCLKACNLNIKSTRAFKELMQRRIKQTNDYR